MVVWHNYLLRIVHPIALRIPSKSSHASSCSNYRQFDFPLPDQVIQSHDETQGAMANIHVNLVVLSLGQGQTTS
jgi:hypothetical protein